MKLFDYAVIYHGKKDKDGEVVEKPVVIKKDCILGHDEKQIALIAAREIPEIYLDKLDKVEVIVRPF